MKKVKSALALCAALAVCAGVAGCNNQPASTTAATTAATPAATTAATTKAADGDNTTAATQAPEPAVKEYAPEEIKDFTAFFAVPGTELEPENDIKEIIAKKVGARCKETWLTGQTAEEAIGVMVAGGKYADFVDASTGMSTMVDAGGFIPIDEYWDGLDNLQNFWSESEWNAIRNQDDGHIYIIPQFGNVNMYDTATVHNDEAFWIQTRVLKWDNYPKIETLDDYFDLIERYIAANPTAADGTPNIGYEILSDDWRYFCLENAPFFLDGYPNDGCVIVDRATHQAIDYNTTPTAKRYFQKLNEEYKKGIIDPETFTMNYDAYISKVSSGRVCGMVDQYWDFSQAEQSIKQAGLNDCTYIPLGLTIDRGIREHYHSAAALDTSNGVGVTVSCSDPKAALKFLNDLLDPEIQRLRHWGVEGEDYLVDAQGKFYRTQEMRDRGNDKAWQAKHSCGYGYFPGKSGMDYDGINAYDASHQPGEFYDALSDEVKECFSAYGVETYVQLLDPSEENAPWYPMWSYSNALTSETPDGEVWANMAEVKHEYLPKVVMADDFETGWNEYLSVYNRRCDIQVFLDGINAEIQRRIDVANG